MRANEKTGVYQFNVKLRKLAGCNIREDELEWETWNEFVSFREKLMKRFSWIGDVYLTGRSNGWLAVEDKRGGSLKRREASLAKIEGMVSEAVKAFQARLWDEYGSQNNRDPSLN